MGPAEAPKFGSGSHAARGGVNPPSASPAADGEDHAMVVELVAILRDAIRVSGACQQIFSRLREDSGLTGIEVLTLMAITHATEPPTVPQVGRALGHPRQVIQRAVRVLDEEGLVQPQPNPGHKRAALLVATEQGREFGRNIDAQAAEIIADLAGGLDLDLRALTSMGHGLLALRDRMDQIGGEA
ncbi:MAG: MarR family transcriptional regulator [Sphingomonadales bacterium]|nr:MarR family transcriptional regulator [Sphingomonadales bacterium]